MTVAFWIVYALILIPSLLALGWLFFKEWAVFFEALWYDFIPDILSLIRGELANDWRAEFKLQFFLLAGLLIAVLEHGLIEVVFERIMK